MDKVLIKLYAPILEEIYDMWIPAHRKIGEVILLLIKAINELSEGEYNPKNPPKLYDKLTSETYDVNLTVKETNIRSGSELILI